MKAMVLAAGYGTRLSPMTDYAPKPAIPFCGLPIIRHTLQRLARFGVREVVVNVHHLGDVMERIAREHCPADMTLVFSREPTNALGTAGGIAYAAEYLADTDPLLVVNGDVLPGIDPQRGLTAHCTSAAAATLLLTDAPYASEFFGVAVDDTSQILGFWGPSTPQERGRYAYTGMQWISHRLRQSLPRETAACIKKDGWVKAIERQDRVIGVRSAGTWYDLGTPARYLFAHRLVGPELSEWTEWPERQPGVFSAEPIPSHVECHGPCTIGPRFHADGPVHLGPDTHIGADVTIAQGARLSNTVVWDESNVAGTHTGTIIGPFGLLSAA